MTATLLPEGKQSFETSTGAPLVGGKVYTYDSGTTTPKSTWSDALQTAVNTNPIILDARGEATIYWEGAYKVVLKDSTDVTIWTVDPVSGPQSPAEVGWTNVLDYGAVGDGVTNDTAAIQAAINATPAGGTVLIPGNGNVYAITGVTTPFNQYRNIVGIGTPILKALPGATILLAYTGSASYPPANKLVSGLRFDGNLVSGVVGMKMGDTLSPVVQLTVRDCFAINCDIGFWNYSSQSILFDSVFTFYNRIGYVLEQDATNGGATICTHIHFVCQYNYVGMVVNGLGIYPLDTLNFNGCEFQSNRITQIAGWNITDPCEVSNTHIEAPTETKTAVCGTTNGLNTVTYARGTGGNDYIWVGAGVTGVGIQVGSIITAISLTGFTLSLPATANGTPTLTFTQQPITYAGRTIAVSPVQFTACNVSFVRVAFGVNEPGILLTGGNTNLSFDDMSGFSGGVFIDGALTDKVSFYGECQLNMQIKAHIDKWPDTILSLDAPTVMIGETAIIRQEVVPNKYTALNPKVPVFNNINAATASISIDASAGPVAAVQYTATAGSLAGNYVTIDLTPSGTVAGDKWAHMVLIRADTATNITFRNDYMSKSFAINTEWRLLKIFYTATGAGALNNFFWPTGTDAPKVYFSNVMSVSAATGVNLDQLTELLAKSVWNDNGARGGLMAKVTALNPANLAANTYYTGTATVAVPGARAGNVAEVTFDQYNLGITWTGQVSAADTVQPVQQNWSAGAIDQASGNLTVWVKY